MCFFIDSALTEEINFATYPESLVTSLLKTGSELFLRAALTNHRRRSRGGHCEVGADVIPRLAREEQKEAGEEKEEAKEKQELYRFHSRKVA